MKVIDKLLKHAPMSVKLMGVGTGLAVGVVACGGDKGNGPGEPSDDSSSSGYVLDSSSSSCSAWFNPSSSSITVIQSSSDGTILSSSSVILSSSGTISSSSSTIMPSSSSVRLSSSSLFSSSSILSSSSAAKSSAASSSSQQQSSSSQQQSSSSSYDWGWLLKLMAEPGSQMDSDEAVAQIGGALYGCAYPSSFTPASELKIFPTKQAVLDEPLYSKLTDIDCLAPVELVAEGVRTGRWYAISGVPTTSDPATIVEDDVVNGWTVFKGILECMAFMGPSQCKQSTLACEGGSNEITLTFDRYTGSSKIAKLLTEYQNSKFCK